MYVAQSPRITPIDVTRTLRVRARLRDDLVWLDDTEAEIPRDVVADLCLWARPGQDLEATMTYSIVGEYEHEGMGDYGYQGDYLEIETSMISATLKINGVDCEMTDRRRWLVWEWLRERIEDGADEVAMAEVVA